MPEKFSKYLDIAIEITFLALVLFAPLFFDRRIGIVFSLSKATWIRALTLIILGLIGTKLFSTKGNKFVRTPMDIPVLTYILVVAAATIFSINVWITFIGSYGRYEGFITILNYVVLFFLTTNFITTLEKKRRIMILSVMAALVMAIYGIIQRAGLDPYAWGGVVTNERIIAMIGQPNFLAAYLDMAFLMGVYLLFTLKKNMPIYFTKKASPQPTKKHLKNNQNNKKPKYTVDWNEMVFQLKYFVCFISVPAIFVYAIYFVDGNMYFFRWLLVFFIVVGLAIYYSFGLEDLDYRLTSFSITVSLFMISAGILSTQSRGGLVGLLCGISVFAIIAGRQVLFENKWKIATFMAGIFIVGAVSMANISMVQLNRMMNEVSVSKSEGASKIEAQGAAGSRIETWTSAFSVISERPLLGIGPEVIKMVFPQHETPKFRYKEAFHVKQDRCHNETLDMTVTRGVLGLVVYVWMLAFIIWFGISQTKADPSKKVFIAGLVGAMASYLAQNQFSFGVVAITSLFWIIMGMMAPESEKEASKPAKVKVELIMIIWVLIGALIYVSSFPYIGDKFFKSAQNSSLSGQYSRSFEEFDKALRYMTFDGGYYTHYGMTIMNSKVGQPPDPDLLNKAIAVFSKGQKVDPYNADNFYMSGRAYIILNDLGKGNFLGSAEELSRKAITIDRYYAEAYQNLSYILERRGDISGAIKLYEKAFDANPTNIEIGRSIYRYYSQIGQTDKAFKILEAPLEIFPSNPDLLVALGDLYRETNLPDKAFSRYSDALAINPSDVRAMVGVGMVFLQKGRKSEAFNKFQEAMMIDPANPLLHNGLGAYYINSGDRTRAKQEFEQTLSVDPGNEFAKRMLGMLR